MSDIEEQIQKLREHVPEDKSDDDIRRLIEEAGGDEVSRYTPQDQISFNFFLCIQPNKLLAYCAQNLISQKIAEWWESGGNDGTLIIF